MSVTRLKRKHRKNIARANNKQRVIKNMLRTPVLKNVDLEELKSRFTTSAVAATPVAAAPASTTSVVEKVKHAAAEAAEAIAHSPLVEKLKDAASDAVEAVKHAVGADDEAAPAHAAE